MHNSFFIDFFCILLPSKSTIMKKSYLLLILLPFLISFKIYAQNLTVDFSACTNSTDCRIFWNNAPPALITTVLCSGTTIFTTHGSPHYFTSSKRAVELESAYSSSENNFEGFAISYNFKVGYSYQFKITATGMKPNGTVYPERPTLVLSLLPSNIIKNDDGCGFGQLDQFETLIDEYYPQQFTTGTTIGQSESPLPSDIHTVNFPSLHSSFSYLSLRTNTAPGFSTTPNYQALIYKVEIIETKSPFTVSQSSGSITCQTQTSKTFTVNNPNSIPGVTGYNWNLGTQPNGWIYNGSPAPQFINTISNTLTLQNAINAPVLNSPTVTVMVNNAVWGSYTSTVSYDPCPCLPSPVSPANLHVTSITHSSAIVSWDAQPGVSFYGNYYGATSNSFSTSSNSVTLTSLKTNSSYTVYLYATNCHGSNGGQPISFTTSTCPAPTNVTASITSGGISISWTPVSGGAEYYLFGADNLTNPSSNYCCGSASSPPVLFNYVNSGNTYQAYVKAVCDASNVSPISIKSAPVTYVPCASPTGAPYGQPSGNSIYLYFPNAPTGCLSYNLKYRNYSNPSLEYTVLSIPTASTYILTSSNLVKGQSYQFAIQSNCSSGSTSDYGPWSTTPTGYYRIMEHIKSNKKNLSDSVTLDYHQDSLSAKKNINKFSSALVLYPNPAESEITISFENQEMAKPELVIINSLGKEVLKKNLANLNSGGTQSDKINVSKFSNGVYIVKLKLGTKVLTEKFVIQR